MNETSSTTQSVTDSHVTASRTLWSVVAVGFALILLDGYDTAAMPASIPLVARQWGIAPSGFTWALTITNIGAVGGFFISHKVGEKLGPKRALLIGSTGFGLLSLALIPVFASGSMPLLLVVRVVTGLCLGVVLPVAIAFATHNAQARHRGLVSVVITLGLSAGATLIGLVARPLITGLGLSSLFIVGGITPILVAALAAIVLPTQRTLTEEDDQDYAAQNVPQHSSGIASLFRDGLSVQTIMLWAFAFLIFTVYYLLTNWIPTLMPSFGFAEDAGPLGMGIFNLGAVLGGLLLMFVVTKMHVLHPMTLMPFIGALAVFGVVRLQLTPAIVLLFLAIAGAGIVAGQIGQLTAAVQIYDEHHRTVAVGTTAAFGRLGSIIGPLVGGLMLQAGLQGRDIVQILVVPLVLSVIVALIINLRYHRGRKAEKQTLGTP